MVEEEEEEGNDRVCVCVCMCVCVCLFVCLLVACKKNNYLRHIIIYNELQFELMKEYEPNISRHAHYRVVVHF